MMDIPPVSKNDVARFNQLFQRIVSDPADRIGGIQAKQLFVKSKLSADILGNIWAMCDRSTAGSLNRAEFILAMHLIELCRIVQPTLDQLPTAIPRDIWIRTEKLIGLQAYTRFNWDITVDEKRAFDQIFDSLDVDGKGELSSDTLANFLLSTKLDQNTLERVWDLANVYDAEAFDKTEFAIAMLLVKCKKSGAPLPNTLPNEILDSTILSLDKAKSVDARINSEEKLYMQLKQEEELLIKKLQQVVEGQESLRKQLQATNDSKVTVQKQLNDLKEKSKELTSNRKSLQNDLSNLKEIYENLSQDLTISEANYHAIEARLAKTNNTYEKMLSEQVEASEQLEQSNSHLRDYQQKLVAQQQRCKAQLAQTQSVLSKLDTQDITSENLEDELTKLVDRISTYQSKGKELDAYEEQLAKQLAESTTRQNRITEENSLLDGRVKDLEKLKVKLSQQETTYKEQLEHFVENGAKLVQETLK